QEALQARGAEQWAEKLVQMRAELALAMATLRMTANAGIILAMVDLLRPEPPESRLLHYLAALIASSMVILVFSVAVPNAWAKYAGEVFLARTVLLLRACRWILAPVTSFLRLFDGLVRRLAGVQAEAPQGDGSEGREDLEREILDVVSEGEVHGAVDEDEKEMIESVIELRDTQAGQIMTPRTEMVTVAAGATLEQVKELIAREGHSRIPVCDGSLDKVVGVLYAKDLLQVSDEKDFDVRKVMRTVPFVPETKSLRDLLHEFQDKKVHIAIVLDEYGGTAGLVTIEDILEELVGEIADEYEPPEPEPIVRLGPDAVEIDARMRVDELNAALGVSLPEDEGYDTVGGFVFSTLGRIPKSGEQFVHGQLRVTVVQAEPRRINRLRVERLSDK
ncbi:MAG: hemolysin family protein, partial [Phycisphaerae bacterium]